jgi:hypothetical protein
MATSQRCCHLPGEMLNSAAECADRARIEESSIKKQKYNGISYNAFSANPESSIMDSCIKESPIVSYLANPESSIMYYSIKESPTMSYSSNIVINYTLTLAGCACTQLLRVTTLFSFCLC